MSSSMFTSIVCWSTVSAADQPYITKYDNVDLDEIFNSKRLLDNYMNCLKDVGPCTPDGRELKDNLPDALMSDCAKCSEKQRIGSDKVIRFIIANRPEDFTILERLYDPTGEYRRKYMQSDALIERVKQEAGELSSSGDGTVETEGHATEHNSSEDHGEGRMVASENLKQKSE
ncbi:ejaculatory bulb-specific protein 3-like [Anopheles moucheti]|uniref:ejaculatory bulb-specific protein 3-like n=1 Tax=Anopheles moucheti TaxID=186751 RepID=UPI0022F143C8|nr:ejaculatory bulb-specific protein 3-like [Anopheles moucheti]